MFFLFVLFPFLLFHFLDAKTGIKSSRSSHCENDVFLLWKFDFWAPVDKGGGVWSGPFEGDSAFMFFIFPFFSIFLSLFFMERCFSSLFSPKYMSLPPLEAGFNKRCFLRSRCSMEMWCPDDMERDKLGSRWATYLGESMI